MNEARRITEDAFFSPSAGASSGLTYALIPAHNEADEIVQTLEALITQMPAHRVTVVADNCTDETVELAKSVGVNVIETVGNVDKKAGALNQAMRIVLPKLNPTDWVMVLDADTRMSENFMEVAEDVLRNSPELGAVGGLFYGRQPFGWLQRCQYNEYIRYSRETGIKKRVAVLTGTASLIRVRALRQVASARGDLIPGELGDVYDRTALTEDMELTLALLSLGWSLASPAECTTVTQLMPTIKALRQQRVRWYRGALENLKTYGLTPVTKRYFGQQIMLLLGAIAMMLYLVVTVLDIIFGFFALNWFWTSVGVIFALERVITVWQGGWKSRVMAALLIPEIAYDVLLQFAFFTALFNVLLKTERQWHHNTQVPSQSG